MFTIWHLELHCHPSIHHLKQVSKSLPTGFRNSYSDFLMWKLKKAKIRNAYDSNQTTQRPLIPIWMHLHSLCSPLMYSGLQSGYVMGIKEAVALQTWSDKECVSGYHENDETPVIRGGNSSQDPQRQVGTLPVSSQRNSQQHQASLIPRAWLPSVRITHLCLFLLLHCGPSFHLPS